MPPRVLTAQHLVHVARPKTPSSLIHLKRFSWIYSVEMNIWKKFMKQLLSMCSLAKLKTVEINRLQKHASSPSDQVYNMICGICPPNISVRLDLFP
ncbi:hypothetical protein BRADI_2g36588v3 [Brachypodium distachyon]|uniref:Uncharacterized protein n=1 Tax=Brachypodium distachyon TaxID=15368 RepID=A0A2K2DC62_BRADI|nr:hypothetical protein BRADI_2g36588v3 [Brachypodium distachyon]